MVFAAVSPCGILLKNILKGFIDDVGIEVWFNFLWYIWVSLEGKVWSLFVLVLLLGSQQEG